MPKCNSPVFLRLFAVKQEFIMLKSIYAFGLSLIFTIGFCATATAKDLMPPKGDVILTVSGDISSKNVEETLQFDLDALINLDQTTFETTTIWTEGKHTFQGVSLDVFIALIGAENATLFATAINDYTVEIPSTEAKSDGPIIAYFMDGKPMSIREKGPLWIVFPYDSKTDYRTEVVYSRSIWQLDRINVSK
jgi:hypothetical protein